MMGQQTRTESLFYYFRLEDQIPKDHLLRVIEMSQIDLSFRARASEGPLQCDRSAPRLIRGAAAIAIAGLSLRDYQ